MAQPSWDFPSGAREEKRMEEKRREAREEKIREAREERTRELREPRETSRESPQNASRDSSFGDSSARDSSARDSLRHSSSRDSLRDSSRDPSSRDPIDDKLRKFSEKPSRSPRSLAAAPASSLPDRGAPFQRLVSFLTALPLGLALFAFVLLDDPPVDPSPSASSLSSSPGGNSTADLQSTHPGCSRAVKTEFLFPSRPWHSSLQPLGYPRLGIMTTTAAGLEQILPWLYYHRTLGVEMFFLFAEGHVTQPENAAVLATIPGVKVIPRNKELDEFQEYKPGKNNKTLIWAMAGRPCNYELFVRQALNGDTAIPMAKAEGVDWLIHIDTDELLYPAGAPDFSVQTLLAGMDPAVDHVVFPNYETLVERDDISEPFLEVSLFKKSPEHVPKDVFGKHAGQAMHGNPNYMLTYGNGKGAGRVQDGLRSNGAHRFNIPHKKYKEKMLKESAVLHYSYTRFADLTSRRKRCHCRVTKKSLKTCFFLEFDRQAYVVASTQTDDQMLQWFRSRVVWSDTRKVEKLLRAGLFARIYTPQVIMRGIISSGLIEATLRAGQEEHARQEAERLRAMGNLTGAAGGGLGGGGAGSWAGILGGAFGLVGSKGGRGGGSLSDFGLRGKRLKDVVKGPKGGGSSGRDVARKQLQ